MFDCQDPDDLRRQGLELQTQLPQPSRRALARAARRAERAGPVELVAGAADLGIWGALLAVPAAVIWWISRRRRPTNPHPHH